MSNGADYGTGSLYGKTPTEDLLDLVIEVMPEFEATAEIPEYKTEGAAGFDLVAANVNFDHDHHFEEFGTGLRMQIPKGYVGLLFPRSSISEHNHTMANCVGVIDDDYRGEVRVRLRDFNPESCMPQYSVGDRVAQMVIIKKSKVKIRVGKVNTTVRGDGGFGST